MEQIKQGPLSATRDLGARVNSLREKLGKAPLANPVKLGAAKLQEQFAALQAEHDARFTLSPSSPAERSAEAVASDEFQIPEHVDAEALLQRGTVETIKACSERLLQHIHSTDPSDKRSVALMYKTVLKLVLAKFPRAHTTVECLRWYAVHMRAEDKRLPQKRPRPPVRA